MAHSNNNANRGFASMDDEDKQRNIASEGGKASGGKNLANANRSKAGKKGARAQSRTAKVKGGRNSHNSGA